MSGLTDLLKNIWITVASFVDVLTTFIQKVFDAVSCDILLVKLVYYGMFISWSFLKNRK